MARGKTLILREIKSYPLFTRVMRQHGKRTVCPDGTEYIYHYGSLRKVKTRNYGRAVS